MKVIVITGSTRGIGYGLAESFLARGCAVVISGRTPDTVAEAVTKLQTDFATHQVFGVSCDVTDYDQVQHLWDESVKHFGQIDVWINNAGLSGPQKPLWEQSPHMAHTVINTNLVGVIYGTKVAMTGMLEQGIGAIYSMEGMGSDGRMREGLTLYGMSKCGLRYFNEAVAKEAKDTPILIGALHPGMVATDLILNDYRGKPEEWEKVKKIFNIIADRVETVTPWLADKVLSNQKNGVRFKWSSNLKLMVRFITAPFNKRDIFYDMEL